MVMLNYRVIENPQFSPNNSHGISSIVSAPVIHIVEGGVGWWSNLLTGMWTVLILINRVIIFICHWLIEWGKDGAGNVVKLPTLQR